jgi:HSP20 family protein
MAIVRFDPFREFVALQDRMNRLMGEQYRRDDDVMSRGAWMPPVDIYQNGQNEIVLRAELPGLKRDDIKLNVENSTLTLSGERRLDHEVKEEHFHRVERSYGSFTRSFTLPNTVATDKVTAEYKDGVLTVRLPIREEAKPKQIQVQVS